MTDLELLRLSAKRYRFKLLEIDPELFGEVIDGLDSGRLTLDTAEALLAGRGIQLSYEAIRSCYNALRRERRAWELSRGVERILEDYKAEDLEGKVRALTDLLITTTAVGLADGSVGVKDVDLGKAMPLLIQVLAGGDRPRGAAEDAGGQAAGKTNKGLSEDAADEIRRRILGIE